MGDQLGAGADPDALGGLSELHAGVEGPGAGGAAVDVGVGGDVQHEGRGVGPSFWGLPAEPLVNHEPSRRVLPTASDDRPASR